MKHRTGVWAKAIVAGIFVTLVCVLAIVLFSRAGASPDLSYRSADYHVDVLPNGDLKITEHIDVKLDDRDKPWRQLYQRYKIDPDQLTGIADISVRNTTSGITYTQTDPVMPGEDTNGVWDSTYANHWYIARVNGDDLQSYDASETPSSGTVELGWNIPAISQADSLGFDITMTFQGVSTAYDDVAAFQWEPVGTTNQVPIGKLTGTVTFPRGITAKNSWAWLHYEGSSTTSRGSDGSLKFTAYNVQSGDYLDLVAMFDVTKTSGVARQREGTYKNTLITSENQKEKAWKERQSAQAAVLVVKVTAAVLIAIALVAWLVISTVFSRRKAACPKDVVYRHEPPDMSPNNAARLNGVLDDVSDEQTNARALSATMLSLASKHAIRILPGSSEAYDGINIVNPDARMLSTAIVASPVTQGMASGTSDNVTIVIEPVSDDPNTRKQLNLCDSEDALLDFLQTVGHRLNSRVFDMFRLRESIGDWESGARKQESMVERFKSEFALLNATTSNGISTIVAAICSVIYGLVCRELFVDNVAMQFALILPVVFCMTVCMCLRRGVGLTDNGRVLAMQVEGLKQYLNDFSDFKDRGVLDLALWDRYLVYAAAFGMSAQVMRQLAQAVPELSDPAWLDANASDSLLYWMYRPTYWNRGFGTNSAAAFGGAVAGTSFTPSTFADLGTQLDAGFAQVQDAVETVLHPVDSSGGGLSGGSFGGGGFGGGGGGAGGGSFGGR
ncbi:DUF2207 domain-containing protein [Bifidobacterium apri]|uniref:DUF2207 domain-containing protein n=1 Tax=Bifidobacterium apri TaxID=1769423 RepID=A0A6A2VVG7_9BIFI|nr:DUF2207 domain-containing protein [Bifidobacterium apri]KAB8299597.1 hypothetical protein DSM100238_0631 [Bifidobacterium apri]